MSNTTDSNMFAGERRRFIVDYVNKHSKASVSELCEQFGVSSATIRNDLNELKELGLLERTHGGAMTTNSVQFEMTSSQKMVKFQQEKKAIAERALAYIHDGDSIGLDAGTTTFEIAKLLRKFNELTVVTYDLNIANYLDHNTSVRIIISGGEVRKNFHYITGDAAYNTIKNLNLDVVFLAANGISIEKGITTPHMDTALLKRTIMGNAKNLILTADHSKISFTKFADLEQMDVFISDNGADMTAINKIRVKNIKVDLAECK